MGLDYGLWKWNKEPPDVTPGLCYLLLAEGVECPEAAPLDVERLLEEIEKAFPDPVKAFTLFEKSALAGCSDGMFNLAACYRYGMER